MALNTIKRYWQFSADYTDHQLLSFLISDYNGILDSHIKLYFFLGKVPAVTKELTNFTGIFAYQMQWNEPH
jgi:hypothetical protein